MKKLFALLLMLCAICVAVGCGSEGSGKGTETEKPLDLSTLLPNPTDALGEKTVKVKEESPDTYSISIYNCSKDEAQSYFDLLKDGEWTENATLSDKIIISSFTAETENRQYRVSAEHSKISLILTVTVSKNDASSNTESEVTEA